MRKHFAFLQYTDKAKMAVYMQTSGLFLKIEEPSAHLDYNIVPLNDDIE